MPEDPAFVLPPDQKFDPQVVAIDDTPVAIFGAFATLGPWKEDLVLRVGEDATIVTAGEEVSFHAVAKDDA